MPCRHAILSAPHAAQALLPESVALYNACTLGCATLKHPTTADDSLLASENALDLTRSSVAAASCRFHRVLWLEERKRSQMWTPRAHTLQQSGCTSLHSKYRAGYVTYLWYLWARPPQSRAVTCIALHQAILLYCFSVGRTRSQTGDSV